MSKLIVDTSVWIEYLGATPRGEKIRPYFENNELFTTALGVGEITAKVLREGKDVEIALNAVLALSTIVSVDFNLGKEAGNAYVTLRKVKPKIALSDALALVTARKLAAKVLTFDKDFDKLPEAIVLC